MSVRAGIVVTGTEVITGRITDRNGPWVSERLGELGVEVADIVTVADRRSDLEAALRFLLEREMDLIVTTGGLGPTADDLTAEVVAEVTGRPMRVDEELEARIAAIIAGFARRMRFDPEGVRAGTRKQAMVPEGAIALDPVGTAPGLVVPTGTSVVLVLPGPPKELQGMWAAALASAPVEAVLKRAPEHELASMRMFGLPESTLAKSLREIESEVALDRLEITTCLRRGADLEIDVRYRVEHRGEVEHLFAGLRERHGTFIFSERGESVDELVGSLLEGHRLAVAESCTAGLLAARITDRPGSSSYFAGGVVAYSNASKADLLGVDPGLIETRGAVSPEVAEAMADGALARFAADVAVAITGVAGPGGGTPEKPVGYVCFCVKSAAGGKLARDPTLPGSRTDIRERSVSVALHLLHRHLRGEDAPL